MSLDIKNPCEGGPARGVASALQVSETETATTAGEASEGREEANVTERLGVVARISRELRAASASVARPGDAIYDQDGLYA